MRASAIEAGLAGGQNTQLPACLAAHRATADRAAGSPAPRPPPPPVVSALFRQAIELHVAAGANGMQVADLRQACGAYMYARGGDLQRAREELDGAAAEAARAIGRAEAAGPVPPEEAHIADFHVRPACDNLRMPGT